MLALSLAKIVLGALGLIGVVISGPMLAAVLLGIALIPVMGAEPEVG